MIFDFEFAAFSRGKSFVLHEIFYNFVNTVL